jgi:hypothetical protein
VELTIRNTHQIKQNMIASLSFFNLQGAVFSFSNKPARAFTRSNHIVALGNALCIAKFTTMKIALEIASDIDRSFRCR